MNTKESLSNHIILPQLPLRINVDTCFTLFLSNFIPHFTRQSVALHWLVICSNKFFFLKRIQKLWLITRWNFMRMDGWWRLRKGIGVDPTLVLILSVWEMNAKWMTDDGKGQAKTGFISVHVKLSACQKVLKWNDDGEMTWLLLFLSSFDFKFQIQLQLYSLAISIPIHSPSNFCGAIHFSFNYKT